jgi:hypothetical protein
VTRRNRIKVTIDRVAQHLHREQVQHCIVHRRPARAGYLTATALRLTPFLPIIQRIDHVTPVTQ